MSLYDDDFYVSRHSNTVHAARTVMTHLADVIPKPMSVVDVGCGIGTWLSIAIENGATDVLGIDGSWVNKNLLAIRDDEFLEHDLSQPLGIDRHFDLAISLEVAEHLPASNASVFLETLTSLSDFVLFSAAIPYQGGVGHLNEQWPNYWIDLFDQRGYLPIDYIRKKIWNDTEIPWWYRQNMLLFVKKERIGELKLSDPESTHIPPEVYLLSYRRAISPGIKLSTRLLVRAIARSLRIRHAKDDT